MLNVWLGYWYSWLYFSNPTPRGTSPVLALLPKVYMGYLSLVQICQSLKVNLQSDLKKNWRYSLFIVVDFKQWLKHNEFWHLLCLKLNVEDVEDAATNANIVAVCFVHCRGKIAVTFFWTIYYAEVKSYWDFTFTYSVTTGQWVLYFNPLNPDMKEQSRGKLKEGVY